ncbi:MAG: RNA methyltransferase [Burkholderiales bacterium]|nr:RNA methyltransferase [Burkholderiales bacterium]
MKSLNNIQIILCNTSHPGNIGSAARAMKTMGLHKLILVDPITQPDDHSLALSCNARDVVENARIVVSLDEVIASSELVIAMTGRKREFSDRLITPKAVIPEIMSAIANDAQVSIVFGNEQHGLTIEQQERCNRLVTIPGNPEYFSLNLAQAVQIMCYEIYSNYNPDLTHLINPVQKANHGDSQYLLASLDKIMQQTEYYTKKNPERIMRRLQKILHKADLEREEADLLHGIFKQIQRKLGQ